EGSTGVTYPTSDGEGAGATTTMDEEEAEAGVEVGGEAETGVERTVEESEEEEPPGIVLSAPWTELTEEGEEIFRDPLRRVFLPPRLLPASAACPAPGEAPASEGGGGGPSEAEVPRSSPGVAEGGVAAMAAPLRPPVGGEEVVSLWKPKEAAGGDAPPSSAVEEEEEEEEPRFERRLSGLRNKLRFLTSARKMGFSEQLRVVDLPALSELPKTPYRPQVVSVFSGKGGVGKSTIAINLAAYLSHVAPNLNVCEVDLDIEHGDTYLIALREEGQDLERRRIPTIYDLVRGIEIGAVTKGEDARPFFVLDGYSGCSFLAAPHFPSQGARIGEREMEAVFRLIKDMGFHVIVLDCGVNLRDEVTQFAIMFSQQVVFVTEASTSSINRVMKGISEILGTPEFGLHPNRIKLVFNKLRKDEDVGIDPKAVRREEFPFVRDVFYLGYDVRVARAWNYGFLGIYTPSKGFKLGIKRIAESVVRDFED
ncbi:MAG: AAA family ATPase, partial [Candidatus Hadarchaeales archaeon]